MVSVRAKREFVEKNTHWHYRFDLGDGIVTAPFAENIQAWHDARRELIFTNLKQIVGDDLSQFTLLDIACNAGFWSFAAADEGVNHIVGFDESDYVVRQAEFISRCRETRRGLSYRFLNKSLFDFDGSQTFDIVFCFGLMYHLTDPIMAAKKIHELTGRLLIVDSATINSREKFFEIGEYGKHGGISKTEYSLVPSKGALHDIFTHAGFSKITEVEVESDKPALRPFSDGARTILLIEK